MVASMADACDHADALLILPGWPESWEDHRPVLHRMLPPGWVFDLRDSSGPVVAQVRGSGADG